MLSNGGLGIDLGGNGVTANDAGDVDSGANDLLNFPVLTSAVGGTASTAVAGTLNSIPGATFTIQFFSSASCDASGHGEGEVLEGATTVVTSSPSGSGSFTVALPRSLTGRFVTATTSTSLTAGGMTSEFSACRSVVAATVPVISFEQGPAAGAVGRVVAPHVRVWLRDSGGAPMSGPTVTLSMLSGPGGATLRGATATTDASGRATFPSLWLDKAGTYQLQAAAAGVTADSTAFAVAALRPGFSQVSAGWEHSCGSDFEWNRRVLGQRTPTGRAQRLPACSRR